MNDEVLEFIHRRFPEDSHWTDGNCYYFALILVDRFGGEILYDRVNGHFVAFIYDCNKYYDYNGEICTLDNFMIPWCSLSHYDSTHYERIKRDCIA